MRVSVRAVLLAGVATLSVGPAFAQDTTAPQPAPTDAADAADSDSAEVIVTGQTTRDRPLITSSADITIANRDDIDRKAPRSTADMLELVPGIFVEATAGQVSNNYSVRGLQGGNQRFVQLEEDGMPILYGGGGSDFFFDQDLTSGQGRFVGRADRQRRRRDHQLHFEAPEFQPRRGGGQG